MNKVRFSSERGHILLLTYLLLGALLAMIGAYASIVDIELATTKHSKDSATGFYAAEAGLNLRAKQIRDIFTGYNRPEGTSPEEEGACEGVNLGTGDFACSSMSLNNREVVSYVTEDPSNPVVLTIPPGELYQNLNAQEYRYSVRSVAFNSQDNTEAILELRFKSRLVPLFQFVAFYDKDLEILPGANMNLSGPLHTNGDLYMDTSASLNIAGQVTTAGDLYRGRKNTALCNSRQVTVIDPSNPLAILPSCSTRTLVPEASLGPWNNMIQVGVDIVTVPPPEALDPTPGQIYWDNADLRLQLRLNGSNEPITDGSSETGIYVMDSAGNVQSAPTAELSECSGQIATSGAGGDLRPVGYSNTFFNNREGSLINMAEIDMRSLFDCLHDTNWFGTGKALDDDTEGGLVLHFSVNGPDSATINNYGVRLRNAEQLQSTDGGAPQVRGLTIVTDQALYTHGHYNSVGKIPAALLSDSYNVLSVAWNLSDATSDEHVNNRQANSTTIQAALLTGTDSTGNAEGAGGQGGGGGTSGGDYNGGLENYPRLHENWSGDTLLYRGSYVSLDTPRKVEGNWVYGNPQYTAPGRNWDYDTDFNDASNLPPLSPRFVYLRQELFVRDFEQ